jgi:hypothetical protein
MRPGKTDSKPINASKISKALDRIRRFSISLLQKHETQTAIAVTNHPILETCWFAHQKTLNRQNPITTADEIIRRLPDVFIRSNFKANFVPTKMNNTQEIMAETYASL